MKWIKITALFFGCLAFLFSCNWLNNNNQTFILNVEISPGGAGYVEYEPDQVSYELDSIVRVTAFSNEGYSFSHWTGDYTGNSNPVSIQMNSTKTITAVFEPEAAPTPVPTGEPTPEPTGEPTGEPTMIPNGYPCDQSIDCESGNCCDGSCTDVDVDVNNCGSCGNNCTNDHGSTSCIDGSCVPVCDYPYWGNCNGDDTDGCERSLTTLTDCGACGEPCNLPNASETCSTGTCLITSCSNGYCNLDGIHSNGCEFDLDTDPACGTYMDIGTVRGDTGSDQLSYSARGERWFRCLVSEGVTGLDICSPLSATIRLSPAADTDYDLYVYFDLCSGDLAGYSSNGGSAADVVIIEWDEAAAITWPVCIPSGTDDGRYVYINVRFWEANICNLYTLTVQGNTGS